jgi:hypothetical protein
VIKTAINQAKFDLFKLNSKHLAGCSLMELNSSSGVIKTGDFQADYFYNRMTNELQFTSVKIFNAHEESNSEEIVNNYLNNAFSEEEVSAQEASNIALDANAEEAGSGSERWYGEGDDWTKTEGAGLTDDTTSAKPHNEFVKPVVSA